MRRWALVGAGAGDFSHLLSSLTVSLLLPSVSILRSIAILLSNLDCFLGNISFSIFISFPEYPRPLRTLTYPVNTPPPLSVSPSLSILPSLAISGCVTEVEADRARRGEALQSALPSTLNTISPSSDSSTLAYNSSLLL